MPQSWGIVAGFALTLLVLAVGSTLGYQNARHLDANRRLVTHTREVLGSLDALLSVLKDAETGQRGYLLTEDATYLQPYQDALQRLSGELTRLTGLISDNPDQLARMAMLDQTIDLRLDELRQTVALTQQGERGAALAIVRSNTGKSLMDDVRNAVAVMQDTESTLLAVRDAEAANSYRATVAVIALTATIGVGLLGVVGHLIRRNLTQKQRASVVLRQREDQFRRTLSEIAIPTLLHGDDDVVLLVNKAWTELSGYRHEDIPTIGDWTQRAYGERHTAVKDYIDKLFDSDVRVDNGEWEVTTATGAKRVWHFFTTPVGREPAGRRLLVSNAIDVTEQRRAEQALHASEERLRMAQHVSKIGTFEWNIQTGVNTWTPELEAMHGLPPGGFAGTQRNWEEMLHPEDRPHVVRSVGEALATGVFADEWRVVWGDGSSHWLAGRGRVFKDDDGKPLRLLGINIDITERKQGEDELRRLAAELSEADRRKDEFLATLAHELRNPLAPIRNGLEILRSDDIRPGHEQVRVMMQRQTDQLVRLVDDLMDVSRITRNTLDLRQERVELALVLQTAVETAKPIVESYGHHLSVTLPSTPAFVDADITRLGQVFANLLNNAAKYTSRGGQIWLTVERQGGELVVSVKDTGVGIPSEMLPKIFEMFAQVDRTLERSQGGLGIGLSLAKRLVEMHGGQIEARSDGPGQGSEFVVRLPAALSLVAQGTPVADEGDAPAAAKQCRILVADDNEDSVTTMAMLLESMDNEVRTANDGLDALRVAEDFEPHVIILDIGMPRLNGYETCRRIRERAFGENVVMIALSGWGQEEDKRRAQEAGFHYHLVKPVAPTTIERLLAQLKLGMPGRQA